MEMLGVQFNIVRAKMILIYNHSKFYTFLISHTSMNFLKFYPAPGPEVQQKDDPVSLFLD